MDENIKEALSWGIIYCSEFECVLLVKDGVYKYDGKILDSNDPRLIAYLKSTEGMKPIDWKW